MEIISYVVSGALRHEDSMGNGSVIRPGDVQRMTAGSGVRHSEYNASDEEDAHFLQIWIEPEALNLPPGYEQKAFGAAEKANRLRLVVSRDGRDGSVSIHRDADIHAGLLESGVTLTHEFAAGRLGWLQVVRGALSANGAVPAGRRWLCPARCDDSGITGDCGDRSAIVRYGLTAFTTARRYT